MTTYTKTGRSKRHRIGYIAVGYSSEMDFWYSSEGVFATSKLAQENLLQEYYPVDFAYAVKVDLKIPKE